MAVHADVEPRQLCAASYASFAAAAMTSSHYRSCIGSVHEAGDPYLLSQYATFTRNVLLG
jgi:hypothetical protein